MLDSVLYRDVTLVHVKLAEHLILHPPEVIVHKYIIFISLLNFKKIYFTLFSQLYSYINRSARVLIKINLV